jgi:hypothetical protein
VNIGTDLVAGSGHTSGAATQLIASYDPARLITASPTIPVPDLTAIEVFGTTLAVRTAGTDVRSIRGRAVMQLRSGVWVFIAGELIGTSIGSPALSAVATNIVNVPNGSVPARPLVGISATGIAGAEIDWGIMLESTLFSP